ncbi:hypothetical protein ANO11243_027700 [Dothideomycetidae sp. 11243]|nr:hypothetical protein ANO11243_027700 [fungal sp. No.11243]
MARSRNPLAFTPGPVSVFTSAIYIAIFAVLLVVHHNVPPAPTSEVPKHWPGVNLTQAWHDLQTLSSQHHPFNSRANLELRAWLEGRIGDILDSNRVDWATEVDAVLLDDRASNITFPDARPYVNYFEGDNLMVYIRGTADPEGAFWNRRDSPDAHLVLVNSHYDSVSTGYGATDDGVGVISCLQLISHFTSPDTPKPRHGLLILINDAEEDGLYGATAYAKHPMARHTSAFLNLEGAGAGGRATLFRSTDVDVTAPYGASEHPFGTVVSADGFKFGLVRSGTDYEVFSEWLGMRGLDVAFMEPRSAYHTPRDDVRDTSKASVWHMLSAALATTTGLVKQDWQKGEENQIGGVWFDIFGLVFAVLRLHTLFALNVTLLVVGPVTLIALELLLKKQGKWYPFSFKTYLHGQDDDEPVQLYGLKGFFRFPLTFIVSTAAVVALSFLVTKINPYIVYSSPYAVWAMMMSAFVAISWFLLRLGDSVRPSALSRFYTLLWIYMLSWLFLIAATVGVDRYGLGGGYFFIVYNAAVFAALLVSYLEFFALPSKERYAIRVTGAAESRRESQSGQRPASSQAGEDGEANERTALLSPTNGPSRNDRQTFARYNQRRHSQDPAADDGDNGSVLTLSGAQPYEHEQTWSAYLPRWTWLVQLVLILPINLILIGQGGLLLTTALAQTPADGNAVLTIYVAIAVLSALMLVPSAPFMHRVVWQIPTFLFLVCVGTIAYNLVADPFSRESRLKVFFVQRIDVKTGRNEVALIGVGGWLEKVVEEMPSTAGQRVTCGHGIRDWASRNELKTCVWEGSTPDVLKYSANSARGHKKPAMKDWLSVDVKALNSSTSRRYLVEMSGVNTRSCRLYFDEGIANFTACAKGMQESVPGVEITAKHSTQLRLWSRTFDPTFRVVVDVAHNSSKTISGKAVCLWSDANQLGLIPAYDELEKFAPVWVAPTKHADGLVEGVKAFSF